MDRVFGGIKELILDFLEEDHPGDIKPQRKNNSEDTGLQSKNDLGSVELEARLGRICSSLTNERVMFDVKHPIIMGNRARGVFFKSGVERSFFNRMKALHASSTMTQTTDTVYIMDSDIRKIVKGKEVIYQRKERRRTITIYCPDCPYDVRVSFSVEKSVSPEEVGEVHSEISNESTNDNAFYEGEKRPVSGTWHKVLQVRNRNRESYKYENYAVDFTMVSKSMNFENNDKSIFEVEVEVTNPNYDKAEFASVILNLPRKDF
ncbi:hypothetical protein PAEPH01_0391 [Pancytospora epiphaga]|nr:hypothetical protein PAEPH01_0391 [Pancytospora epiphaga]